MGQTSLSFRHSVGYADLLVVVEVGDAAQNRLMLGARWILFVDPWWIRMVDPWWRVVQGGARSLQLSDI